MDGKTEFLKKKLLKAQINTSAIKIAAIDNVIKNGTIENKLDLILLDIRARELEKLSKNEFERDYQQGGYHAERID